GAGTRAVLQLQGRSRGPLGTAGRPARRTWWQRASGASARCPRRSDADDDGPRLARR
ncbi:unnamed protein product, partial [Prorocentrum cordatum]